MTDKSEEAQQPLEPQIYRDRAKIDRLLIAKSLAARVAANKRLTETFRIVNPFSSNDTKWLQNYRGTRNKEWSIKPEQGGLTTEIFNHASEHWLELKQRATRIFNLILERHEKPNLVKMVRTVTFAAILPLIFFRDPPLGILFDGEEEEHVNMDENGSQVSSGDGGPNTKRDKITKALEVCEEAATLINELWVQSKKSDPDKKEATKKAMNEENLRLCLARIFGTDYASEGQKNPLNFILPAFETSWRVILRIVLEVLFREMHHPKHERLEQRKLWLKVLEDAAKIFKAAEEQNRSTQKGKGQKVIVRGELLRDQRNSSTISVHDIIREGLRLYPPMRRIHRLDEAKDVAPQVEHVADIEYMQREGWPQEHRFEPSQWLGIEAHPPTREDREQISWRPFGWGSRSCVAQKAGPTMLSVLVVALVEALQSRNFKIQCKEEESEQALHGVGPLVHDRKAYEDMVLVTEDTEDDFSGARESLGLDEQGTKHGRSTGSKLPFRQAEEHNNSTEG